MIVFMHYFEQMSSAYGGWSPNSYWGSSRGPHWGPSVLHTPLLSTPGKNQTVDHDGNKQGSIPARIFPTSIPLLAWELTDYSFLHKFVTNLVHSLSLFITKQFNRTCAFVRHRQNQNIFVDKRVTSRGVYFRWDSQWAGHDTAAVHNRFIMSSYQHI